MDATNRWDSLRYAGLAALAVVVNGCVAQGGWGGKYWEAAVVEHKTLEEQIASLEVTTRAGRIEVLPADGAEMIVEATVRAEKKHIEEHELTGVFSDHVTVSSAGAKLKIAEAHASAWDKKHWQVSLKIMLPRALSVQATSGAGDVRVRQAAGTVSLTSGAGQVKVALLEAPPGGDVELNSGAGNVVLELPGEVNGRFDIAAGVGSVKVDSTLGLKVKRHVVGATASGTVGSGGPTYKLATGAGTVTVKVRN